MTIDAHPLHRQSPPPEGFPISVGWTPAAIAVNSSLHLSAPVHLRMTIDGHAPLLIDFGRNAFSWSTPLEQFPVDAVHTGLETIPVAPGDPPFFAPPGQDLDGLLWLIGLNAFAGARAFWLPAGERYRLVRWPNLTRHAHTMVQMQMLAALANAHAGTAELAALVGADESEARRLVNALSLMRILSRSAAPAVEEAAAPTAPTATEAEAETTETADDRRRPGLFARLRRRLGR
jgi:hypothetical protein